VEVNIPISYWLLPLCKVEVFPYGFSFIFFVVQQYRRENLLKGWVGGDLFFGGSGGRRNFEWDPNVNCRARRLFKMQAFNHSKFFSPLTPATSSVFKIK